MDESSFTGTSKGISMVLGESTSGFMNVEDLIMDTKAYQECKIEPIPWRQTLGYVSMAVSKDSPFKEFMNSVILDIIQSGILEQSQTKWAIKKADCQPEVKPISFQKVILSFTGISVGMIFALIMLIVEKKFRNIYKKNEPKYCYIREELRVCLEKVRNHKNKIPDQNLKVMIREINCKHRLQKEGKNR